ncbi:MAG: L,D-transpeptidase [Bauldia sp.]
MKISALALTGTILLAALHPAAAAGTNVAFGGEATSGTIVIMTTERRLYLVLGDGRALRYVVGVGRAGRQWQGNSTIDGKYLRPNWAPPDAVRDAQPELPAMIPSGAPGNPMGAAAMTLSGGEYAIHGTNSPNSIGGFVSYGCIRMFNADITDLYARVNIGTPVVVLR